MRRSYLLLFLGTLFAISAAAATFNLPVASAVSHELVSAYVTEELPLADPSSDVWNLASPVDVPLSGQTQIAPMNPDPTVTSMKVRSVNDGNWVAFLLEWADPTQDLGGGLLDFKDSAAIQFPSVAGEPFFCMGQSGGTVEILHWRSDFQKHIESGVPNASDIFPNMWTSIYPGGTDSAYRTGEGAGNSLSLTDKTTPVEDLVAGGFGTLTTQVNNDAVGWATWNDGTWKSVVARPMITIDAEDAQFDSGMETSVALAAWDGGKNEIDGKKSVSTWVSLKIDGPAVSQAAATVGTPLPPRTLPAPDAQIIVQSDFPTTFVWSMIGIFAVAVVGVGGVTWVIARRTK